MRSAIHSTTTVFWIAGGTTEHWPRASTWLGGPAHGRVVPGLIMPLLVDLYSAEPRCLRADWISFTYTDITMSHDYTGIFSPGWNWMWGREAFFFYLLYKDSTHAFMNFLPRMKFLVDYMGNFSPINRAENLISSSSNRADVSAPPHGMISSCDRRLRFTKIYVISP